MTRRERVIAALTHQPTDIVPFNADFTMQADDNMLEFTKDSDYLGKLGGHLNYIQYWDGQQNLQTKQTILKMNLVLYGTVQVRTRILVCQLIKWLQTS